MASKNNLKNDAPMRMSVEEERMIRKKPGGSNSGDYDHVSAKNFAGNACGLPGSYPMNTIERARSALAYAHNAKDPDCIRREVYKKWPELKPDDK